MHNLIFLLQDRIGGFLSTSMRSKVPDRAMRPIESDSLDMSLRPTIAAIRTIQLGEAG